jgi:hypothetical protein
LKTIKQYLGVFLCIFLCLSTKAQISEIKIPEIKIDTINASDSAIVDEIDLIDVGKKLLRKETEPRGVSEEIKTTKLQVSGVPAAGYTLQTGFAGVVTANGAFCTNTNANTSIVLTSFTYTARNQIILPLQTNIWTPDNKYNIILDWRYLYFPSYTYGLGQFTSFSDGYMINYSTIHLHQTILREIMPDMYAGFGYNFDYYWNIKELNPHPAVTDFETYGLSPTELASGITLNYLFDSRKNSINPEEGNFVNIIYRPNLTAFGNSATWRSLVLDLRKYINLPAGSRNVLAFWSYEWFTVNGKPPYLMLPSTGSDPYSNTGRGYIQGRYRGDNMAYIESEYRFAVTNNGLFGGVVFANAQAFTLQPSNKIETLIPGWGAGIRIKLNKFSRTNIALDYGFGINGSGGVFVNLGEVF